MKYSVAIAVLLVLTLGVDTFAQLKIKNEKSLVSVMPSSLRSSAFGAQEVAPLSYKSVTLAVALSVLVPGAGELYAGNFDDGKYSLIAEAGIWITYAAFATHAGWVRQDARLFATQHASANFSSKSDKFDVAIGNFLSTGEYNQAKLRNRELDLLYTDPSFTWNWDSDGNRSAFKNERIRSDAIYENAKFVIAAAVINRVYSAFSAGRATLAYNRKVLIEGAWNFEAVPTSTLRFADGINLRCSFTF